MEFIDETKVESGWTLGFEPDGPELLVVTIKAIFKIPEMTGNQIWWKNMFH